MSDSASLYIRNENDDGWLLIGGALPDEPYVTISASGDLTKERVLTAGNGIALTDGGENSTITVAVDPAELITGGNAEVDGDKLDVDWTPTNYTPSTSPAEADSLDNLTAHLYGIDQEIGDVSGLPDAQFVVMALSGDLDAERVLVGGNGLDLTDGGANGNATLDVDPAQLITGGDAEVDGDKLDIDWTPANYTPSTTPAEADSVDNLTAHLYGIDQELSGITDLSGESFVVMALSGDLSAERVLTGGNGLDLTDGGANGNATLDVDPAQLITGGDAEIDGDQLDIDWNPSNYTPATTPAEVTSIDHLTAHLYGIDQELAGVTDISGSQFVVMALSGDLSAERVLTAGDGIDLTDGGVNGNATIAVDVTDILGSGLTETSNNIDLAWGTPTIGTIECDDSASAGTSTNPARSDHQHAIVCAAPITNLSDSSTNAEGSAASFSRSDHAHAVDGITDISDAQYVVMALSGDLSAERVLTAGDGIDLTDGGANGNATVAVDVTDFIDTSYGLTESTNNIRVNLASPSGLEFSGGALQINDTVAGAGLGISSKVLAVGAGNGISVAANSVAVDPAELITGGNAEVDGDKLDIDWTPSNYTPSTSPSEASSVDNLTAHLYGIDQILANAANDLADEQYLVLSASGDLSVERVFTPGDGIDGTDAGAGSTYTVAVDVTDILGNGLGETSNNIYVYALRQSDDGAAALSADAAGDMTAYGGITFNTAETIATSAGDLTIAPTGDVVFNPTGNDILPTTNYDLTFGSTSKKYKEIHASELAVGALVADDTASGVKGRIVIAPTTLLASDLGSAATQMTVEDNEMVKDDTAYLEAAGNVEYILIAGLTITALSQISDYFRVSGDWTATFTNGVKFTVDGSTGNDGEWTTSSSSESGGVTTIYISEEVPSAVADGHILYTGTQGTGPYTYLVVTRNRDGSGANDWYAGDNVANTGQAEDGYIDIYSVDSILGTTTNAASIVGGLRASTTYNDVEETWQLSGSRGLTFLEGTNGSYVAWKESSLAGGTTGYIWNGWAGGAADDIVTYVNATVPTGVSAGDAQLQLRAADTDAGTNYYILLDSSGEFEVTTGADSFINLDGSGQLSLGVDTGPIVNANMTVGLCINQDTNDDEILCGKASEVSHGGYLANTDVFFNIRKAEATSGGALLRGYKDSGGNAGLAMHIQGLLDENANTTKGIGGLGIVDIAGFQTSGGAIANTVADGNVLVVRTYRGGSSVAVMIVDEDGDLHLDAGAGTGGTIHGWVFDDYDDMALLTGLRASTAPEGHEMKERFREFIDYARPVLERTGVVHYNDGPEEDGRPFISTRGLQYLTIDAVRQLYARLERYERALIELGANPAMLKGT